MTEINKIDRTRFIKLRTGIDALFKKDIVETTVVETKKPKRIVLSKDCHNDNQQTMTSYTG
jgi:hypothetical protein